MDKVSLRADVTAVKDIDYVCMLQQPSQQGL